MFEKVYVASANPVKIEATKEGFLQMFPNKKFEFEGMGVSSGIPEQPIGLEQTLMGALNRIENLKKIKKNGNFYVGIEGGIRKMGHDWFAFAWMAVQSESGLTGKAQTGHFMLPPKVISLLEKGYELGDADDIVFGKNNSKQKSGAVGIMTDDKIDRKEYYQHAMILALIPFKKEELFL